MYFIIKYLITQHFWNRPTLVSNMTSNTNWSTHLFVQSKNVGKCFQIKINDIISMLKELPSTIRNERID